MAYMNQEKKAKIAAAIKPLLKKHGIKASFAVRGHSTIVLNIKSAPIDFIANYNKNTARLGGYVTDSSLQVNPYHYNNHFDGKAKEALEEIIPLMYSADYYDNTDAQIDYFDTAYYVSVNIGKWNKPFEVIA